MCGVHHVTIAQRKGDWWTGEGDMYVTRRDKVWNVDAAGHDDSRNGFCCNGQLRRDVDGNVCDGGFGRYECCSPEIVLHCRTIFCLWHKQA
uniref:Uncharacterized protein n=1 Tax=Physcomitrium patens TaxID=3218 RepID=A0A2K1K0E2_PHYPA|nr:hypothetical protein PHYPA_014363 [Physcomitrium patens]